MLWDALVALHNDTFKSSLALLWILIGVGVAILLWPRGRGRRFARQIFALATLSFREGLRQNVLWTVFALSLIPGILAFFSDADGTHAGRARLIIDSCLSTGELFGAALIVLLSSLSLSREIDSRIMYTLGTKPVPRWCVLAGKTIGFWAVDLAYILGLVIFTGVLVRAVPLRAEIRGLRTSMTTDQVSLGGSWEELRRNVLTTRTYENPDPAWGKPKSSYFIEAGKNQTFTYEIDPAALHGEPLEIKFQLLSTAMQYTTQIEDLRVRIAYPNQEPLFDKTMNVRFDRPFSVYLENDQLQRHDSLQMTLYASEQNRYKAKVIVMGSSGATGTSGIRLGFIADGFTGNLAKAFLLMALQGWILALITTGWSGVLSFPVTVALGVLLVLGGEMSRHTIELINSTAQYAQNNAQPAPEGFVKLMTSYVGVALKCFPDFRVAGGPTAFIDGTFLSGWTIAHAALWMGVVRGVLWAVPGAISFQSREVGK
jgi:hypothetical protein